jgi:hypothetical protein
MFTNHDYIPCVYEYQVVTLKFWWICLFVDAGSESIEKGGCLVGGGSFFYNSKLNSRYSKKCYTCSTEKHIYRIFRVTFYPSLTKRFYRSEGRRLNVAVCLIWNKKFPSKNRLSIKHTSLLNFFQVLSIEYPSSSLLDT